MDKLCKDIYSLKWGTEKISTKSNIIHFIAKRSVHNKYKIFRIESKTNIEHDNEFLLKRFFEAGNGKSTRYTNNMQGVHLNNVHINCKSSMYCSLINWSGDYDQCGNLRETIFKVGSMTILYRQTTFVIPLMN